MLFTTKPDFEDGDAVLRTPEGTLFCVHRAILSSASPFFKDLFSLPQPALSTGSEPGDIPVIDMPESAESLETILRLTYPFPDPILAIDDLAELLEIASKYDIATAIARLSRHLLSPK